MLKILKLLSVLCFGITLGVALTWSWLNHETGRYLKQDLAIDKLLDDYWAEEFKSQFFSLSGEGLQSSVLNMRQSEDENFIYYKIDLAEVDSNNLEVEVEEEHIRVAGSVHRLDDGAVEQTFEQILPVPDGVNEHQVRIEQGDGQLVVKFPKVNMKGQVPPHLNKHST